MIDRKKFFDKVRHDPFSGTLTQQQVEGMTAILDAWDADWGDKDRRWLAYSLATTKWETATKMWPVEEIGKGRNQPYGVQDPETKQYYYGRGLIQATWRRNYARADRELGLTGDARTEWFADNMLLPDVAAACLFEGMIEGWYRVVNGKAARLSFYFDESKNDPYNARDIVNGDKAKVPTWTGGVNIGNYIAGDFRAFYVAIESAYTTDPVPPALEQVVTVTVEAPPGVRVEVRVKETPGA